MSSDAPPAGFNPKPELDDIKKQSVYLNDNPALSAVNLGSRNLPPILRPPMGNTKFLKDFCFIV